ncbi:TRAP transporter small permease subunit [Alphaproteobacteria bacterium]|nr:TRAP transporter small permease subunit [Alphaproteobacteria bacterium]MDC1023239.1 TRAP transporter small permease subunit [Alphaproteobacteria bacterium]
MFNYDNKLLGSNFNTLLFRSFGWIILGLISSFLINNFFVLSDDFPTYYNIFDDLNWKSYLTLGFYFLGFIIPILFVISSPLNTLKFDASILHQFNVYLIRACFWVVILVGITDFIISFMRVERILPLIFNDYYVRALSRSAFVGLYIHVPLILIGFIIALFTRTIGFTWLALIIVAGELFIVISRFIFSYEQSFMGDLVRYWYAALFLFASAYTLYEDGHVRVDVFYASKSKKSKGFINAFGCILLGVSTCLVIILIGFDGKQSIINSPIMNFEVTQTGTVGMFIKYQMAAFLGIFALTMLIQFISYFFDSVEDYQNNNDADDQQISQHNF